MKKRKEMSIVSVPIAKVTVMPSLGGESDLLKSLQLMPGIQSGNEASSGLYVRGGSPDQNLHGYRRCSDLLCKSSWRICFQPLIQMQSTV